jgi:PTS system nitrogen regulatory IIA component
MTKKYLSSKEIAQLIGVPLVTVLRWAHQGKIPCKLKDDVYLFRRGEILTWAQTHDLHISEKKTESTLKPESPGISLEKSLRSGGIHLGLEGGDLVTVLKQAVDRIDFPPEADREAILNELLNREEIASTGIGKGVAIPHPRRPLDGVGLTGPMIPVFFLDQEIDFNSVDGEPVFVLFFIFSPTTQVHLKLLSKLSYCLRDKGFMEMLHQRADHEILLQKVADIEREFDRG